MGTRRPITLLAMASFFGMDFGKDDKSVIADVEISDGKIKSVTSLSEDAAIQHEKLQRAEAKRYRKRMNRVRCAGMVC